MQPDIVHINPTGDYKVSRGRRKVPLGRGFGMLDWQRHVSVLPNPETREVSLDEVALHNTQEDAWIIVRGIVYDITKYLPFHPGGIPVLEPYFGRNATMAFEETHGFVNINMIMGKYAIGPLAPVKQHQTRVLGDK